jgi:hypothetical protein
MNEIADQDRKLMPMRWLDQQPSRAHPLMDGTQAQSLDEMAPLRARK